MHADVIIDIPFHDVDSMHVVWHGHYLKYFEIARCNLLAEFGYNYMQMQQSGYLWPVIETHVRYIDSIYYEQKIKVRAILKEWENRLKIDYIIFDAATDKRLTKGDTTQVAVDIATNAMCFQSPPILIQQLQNWSKFRP